MIKNNINKNKLSYIITEFKYAILIIWIVLIILWISIFGTNFNSFY